MVDTLTGKSPDKLEELFSTHRDLVKRQRGLEERLQKAERQKDSVNEWIYDKVISEYRTDLDDVNSDLAPVQTKIKVLRDEAQKGLDVLEPKIKKLQDELAELEFRYRVGEFHQTVFEDKKKVFDERLEEFTGQRNQITKIKKALDREIEHGQQGGMQEGEQDSPPDRTPVSMPEEPEQDQDPAEERAEKALGQEAMDDEFSFENPNEWLNELSQEKKTKKPVDKKPASGGHDAFMDDDPLSALADPSDERSRNEDDAPEKPTGYPNLVIVSGPSSGKKIPLLPMTMSIGREHDNNIELKDPEVARYHARVLYERGGFVLEDLESSTGTWLNGETIKKSPLKNGDKVKFGSTELVIEFN